MQTALSFGIISLLPAVIALVIAIKAKRVIEPLLFGILTAVTILDIAANGWGHAILYSIVNVFQAIAGHPADEAAGIRGMGILKGADRPELVIIVVLLGAFMAVLHKSGGALAFGTWISKKIKSKQAAQSASAVMGCLMFTSAYFSSLATGALFRPVFDRLRVSRAKLAFIVDTTAAPVMAIVPLSGWVAYMATLLRDNIPMEDGFRGLLITIPLNFYSITALVFLFLLTSGIIKDYGPMAVEERETARGDTGSFRIHTGDEPIDEIKHGRAADMIIPLGISIVLLLVLGLWKYALSDPDDEVGGLALSVYQILIVSFSVGIIAGFIRYTLTGLMTATEFLDDAVEGTKTAIIGAMIIILALTLGDLLRASSPEGLGTGPYLKSIAGGMIPHAMVPLSAFVVSSVVAFVMGTSWGTWAIMMPIAIPLTMGGNPYLVAAAVFSGGIFGDHSSPISDTTVMSAIGSDCDHMMHVNTQLPYTLTIAGISAGLSLIMGFDW